MKRILLLAGLALVALAATGCTTSEPNAPLQTYTGPEQPESEVALIQSGIATRILAIDGDPDLPGKGRHGHFSLLPGKHSFRIALTDGGGEPRTVHFELKAGHVYDITALAQPVNGHPWGVVVADRTAGTDIIDPYLARP